MKPIHGTLLMIVAMLQAAQMMMSLDEAAKHIEMRKLFFCRTSIAVSAAGALALKGWLERPNKNNEPG